MSGGVVGRLWTSAIAVGRMHGLTLQVFGEKAGVRWEQERPNQLLFTPVGGRTTTLERGAGGLSPEEQQGSRIAVGHAEGFLEAFANIYADLAEVLRARREKRASNPLSLSFPTAEQGLRSVAAVHAAAESAKSRGAWR
jgi:predicted dehydrogenase